MSSVLPWSYSSLTAFETCPRRYYLTRVAKQVKEPPTEATIHGNAVHKALENAVLGAEALPEKYKQWQPIVMKVRGTPGKKLVEEKFALTSSFKPTTFFAKDAWVRGVIDLGVAGTKTAVILDYKTGKVKVDGDQLRLFAGAAFATMPWIERARTGYIWLAHNKVTSADYTRDDVPAIWAEFASRVQRLQVAAESDKWLPRPSGLCGWCPVGKNHCDFWKGNRGAQR